VHLGRYTEAEKMLDENLALAERVVGRQSSYYLSALISTSAIANEQ
jgi:hypothetical protein